jgi:undecaprenyl pyrophosphate phosphatase UppP
MERKKFIVQVVIAMLLYVVISLILEGDISTETLLRESRDGFIFGLIYGVVIWIWNRRKTNIDS